MIKNKRESKGKKPGEFLENKKKRQNKQAIFNKINAVVNDLWAKNKISDTEERGSFVLGKKEYFVSTTPVYNGCSYKCFMLLKNKGYCYVNVVEKDNGQIYSVEPTNDFSVFISGVNSFVRKNKQIYVVEVKET